MYIDPDVNNVPYLCKLNNDLLKHDSWQFRRGICHRLSAMTGAQLWRHSIITYTWHLNCVIVYMHKIYLTNVLLCYTFKIKFKKLVQIEYNSDYQLSTQNQVCNV